jgi:nucleoside-diphosphate-sugar epimerase
MHRVPRSAFVTGGTGFLGRHIVEQLTALGWHVVALHRPTSDVRHLKAYGVELVDGTITDLKSMRRAMPPSCDAVFHVAGDTSLWSGGDDEQTLVNVEGTRNVVQAAVEKETKWFVHTSSVSAWGEQSQVPFDESARSTALASSINYERTKYLGELEIERGMGRGLRAVIMNPGAVVGRYDTTGWARLIRMVDAEKLQGVPPGANSWADAREVAKAHIEAVDRGRPGDRYLLGGTEATYLEVIRIIGQLTGKKVPDKPLPAWAVRTLGRLSQWGSAVTRKAPDVTPEIAAATTRPPQPFKSDKAFADLDYKPVPLADMLRDSYEWLKEEKLLSS